MVRPPGIEPGAYSLGGDEKPFFELSQFLTLYHKMLDNHLK